jgi:hypothetical protein
MSRDVKTTPDSMFATYLYLVDEEQGRQPP